MRPILKTKIYFNMKKLLFKSIALTVLSVVVAACNPLKKMEKRYPEVQKGFSLKPEPLILKGDSVEFSVDAKIPANYFHKKVFVDFTPQIIYPADGGSSKDQKVKTLRGEATDGEGEKIEFAKGGSFSEKYKFPYEKQMETTAVKMKALGKFKTKSKEFTKDTVIGQGTIITQLLVKGDDRPILAKDNFVKTVPVSYTAEINYLINSSAVQPKELADADMKELLNALRKADSAGITITGVSVSAYASPDGELTLNENLANDRAKSGANAVRDIFKNLSAAEASKKNKKLAAKLDAIAKNTAMFSTAGKGEDWDGFKKLMQASTIKDKDLIIRILEMYSDPQKREQEIKNLAKTYLEVADKILPKLRRAQITVNGEKKSRSDEQIKLTFTTAADSLSVEELLYGATFTNDVNEKIKWYQQAVKMYPNDWRTHNNLAYCYLLQNKLSEAKAELEKAGTTEAIVSNNMGVVQKLMGNRAKAEELYNAATSAGSDVNYNLGIIKIQKGEWESAVANFGESKTFNAALAQLLVGNLDAALNTIDASEDKNSAEGYYLKAIIGARKKNAEMLVNNLKSAISKNASYKEKAKKDAEFIKFRNDANFKSTVQ